MNFVEVLKACENAGGAGTKKAIQAALQTATTETHRLLWEMMNPYRVFGVRKFDRPTHYAASNPTDLSFVFETLNKLDSRELTGNAARDAVTELLSRFTKDAAPYIERILDKDPKGGFSADTVNKVLKEKYGPIPSFEVMLAEKVGEDEEFGDFVKFPAQADLKYDGERTIAMCKKLVTGYEVDYFSRSGKKAEHCYGLFDEDLITFHKKLGDDFILDAERISDLGFTDTMNAKKSGNNAAKGNLRLRAFFLMPLSHWMAQSTTITMRQNREELGKLIERTGVQKILLSEGRIVKDYDDMMDFCNEAIDKPENKARKIEGLIVKELDATYQWDRTHAWTKVKRFYPADGRIIGFYYGRPKSRLEHTVGGAVVAGYTEDGEYYETCVGSGFDDETRAKILANPKHYIGATAVLKYQEVSKAKGKAHAALRFPTLYRKDASGGIRWDKVVEMNDGAVLNFPNRKMIPV